MTELQGEAVLIKLANLELKIVEVLTALSDMVFLLQVCALGVGFIWGAITMLHWIEARKAKYF